MRSSRAEIAARRDEVVRLVARGLVRVDQLSRRLDVSPVTVRRDLAALESAGRLSRTYGGAADPSHFTELHLGERMRRQRGAKQAIGERAAAMLPSRGTVFVDAGSTCVAAVTHIPKESELTVVTRSPEIAIMLTQWPHLRTVLTGGDVALKSHGLVGHLATRTIGQFRYDAALLGVDAVHPVDGVGEPTLQEVATKEVAAERAREVLVLADRTKLNVSGIAAWAPIENWALITDAGDIEIERFRDAGVGVIQVSAVTDED